MSGSSDELNTNASSMPGEQLCRRQSLLNTGHLDSPAMRLQRSLVAQLALLKSVPTIPDFAAVLTPSTLGFLQDVQCQLAIQKTIGSELAAAPMALGTTHVRILGEFQSVAAGTDILQGPLRHAIRSSSVLQQVVSGDIFSKVQSMLAAKESFVSQSSSLFQAARKATRLVSLDMLSAIHSATEARNTITDQLREALRSASELRTQANPNLQLLVDRLSSLHMDELGSVVEELTAQDTLFEEWSVKDTASLATQLEADLAAYPEAAEWSIEEQVNYLIEWTNRQDDSRAKQFMIALIINLLAAVIFWMIAEVIPNVISRSNEARPKAIIKVVQKRIQELQLSTADAAQLRIVSGCNAPVRNNCRRGSPRVAILHVDTLVRACEKRGKWMFVEWTDLETGRSFEGWMLSKHLAPLKKRVWPAN